MVPLLGHVLLLGCLPWGPVPARRPVPVRILVSTTHRLPACSRAEGRTSRTGQMMLTARVTRPHGTGNITASLARPAKTSRATNPREAISWKPSLPDRGSPSRGPRPASRRKSAPHAFSRWRERSVSGMQPRWRGTSRHHWWRLHMLRGYTPAAF
ncbi:hypothetical protein Rumeso_00745 [Rubellimicrobium mesophilum DSM 19309]|uniref:Uncharacterized protein n=1 Tax=Rubellimicrobium mesophilum DSM 19309 TaxID=442562 RepID=A0A017HV26_9RHOB|nr:hypothetical protein Rumeso_00745 [Rubellimicrobium mesophilum DSM 19309]